VENTNPVNNPEVKSIIGRKSSVQRFIVIFTQLLYKKMKSNLIYICWLNNLTMSNKCQKKDCNNDAVVGTNEMCIRHTVDFKAYCKKKNYCVRCTYEKPATPTSLSEDGLLCPRCDYDEYKSHNENKK